MHNFYWLILYLSLQFTVNEPSFFWFKDKQCNGRSGVVVSLHTFYAYLKKSLVYYIVLADALHPENW